MSLERKNAFGVVISRQETSRDVQTGNLVVKQLDPQDPQKVLKTTTVAQEGSRTTVTEVDSAGQQTQIVAQPGQPTTMTVRAKTGEVQSLQTTQEVNGKLVIKGYAPESDPNQLAGQTPTTLEMAHYDEAGRMVIEQVDPKNPQVVLTTTTVETKAEEVITTELDHTKNVETQVIATPNHAIVTQRDTLSNIVTNLKTIEPLGQNGGVVAKEYPPGSGTNFDELQKLDPIKTEQVQKDPLYGLMTTTGSVENGRWVEETTLESQRYVVQTTTYSNPSANTGEPLTTTIEIKNPDGPQTLTLDHKTGKYTLFEMPSRGSSPIIHTGQLQLDEYTLPEIQEKLPQFNLLGETK